MKKLLASVLILALVLLPVNAYLVGREQHPAQAFGGGHVLDLPGVDLNVREYGPAATAKSDEAIVLLHGYTSSIEWWDKVAPTLATDRRVIAIDLVGHGGSEKPSNGDEYGAAGQSKAVREALDALGIKKATLIGHSMGGAVATAVATDDPKRVERIVASDTPGATDLVALPALGKALCWPVIGPALDRFRSIDAVDKSSLQTGFADDYPIPDFAYRSLKAMTHTGMCDSDTTQELEAEKPIADRLAAFNTSGIPVLVLWGERDVLTPTAGNVAKYTEVGLPPKIIAGSGHTTMVEKPDEFLAAIKDFIAQR